VRFRQINCEKADRTVVLRMIDQAVRAKERLFAYELSVPEFIETFFRQLHTALSIDLFLALLRRSGVPPPWTASTIWRAMFANAIARFLWALKMTYGFSISQTPLTSLGSILGN
jgi:hypothetical protein